MKIEGNYNHEKEGRITAEFLDEVLKAGKGQKYLVIKGYFNLEQAMTLQDLLNYMFSKNYEFVRFLTLERNIEGELIFKKC